MPINETEEEFILKTDSINVIIKTINPNTQKYFQFLILVAKTNEKKNAIHEKPGRESSPNLLLKNVFTNFPSGEIKIGIKFLFLFFIEYPFFIRKSILSNLNFISEDIAILKKYYFKYNFLIILKQNSCKRIFLELSIKN